MARKKILAIGMFDSIHFARWLEQFKDQDLEIVILPSKKFRRMNEGLKNLLEKHENYRLVNYIYQLKFSSYIDFFLSKVISIILKKDFRIWLLNFALKNNNFFRVHALEIQGAGYLCLDWTIEFNRKFPFELIVTNWGSDINFYMRDAIHLNKIKKVLGIASYYSAECERDYNLALNLGFAGKLLPCNPNSGGFGFDAGELEVRNIDRDLILVKGYGGIFGRAKLAVEAINSILVEFPKIKIFYYSVTSDIKPLIQNQIKSFNNPISFSTVKSPLSHREILEKFMKSKIYIGISESDGISTSFLEAICAGAYPIQSNTSCANEWIDRGIKGSIVGLSVEEIKKAIRYALLNENLVDVVTINNLSIAKIHLNYNKIKNDSLKFYN